MYWDEKIECASPEEIEKIQSERLVSTIKRVYENVPYYRNRMDEHGVKPEDIKSVKDIVKLPFTLKTDLRDNYPFGTFAVPLKDVTRVHASSGTTGKQTVVGYTDKDLDMWSDCVARCLTSVGIGKDDIVHVSYGYGLFTGGLGLHDGAQKVGATVVPASSGNTKRQIQLLIDFKATVLCCTPSYALYIADALYDMGYSKDDLCLKYGIFGAEPWTDSMREQIEEKLGIKAYDIYGLSEIAGPGVAQTCTELDGLHVHWDHFIPEIVDPDTFEPLPDGEVGELVFTCISKEALPLIRYRTKDLTYITHEKCKCGRTTPRIGKITARSDDMLIIRGVNVFPSQIESVLLSFPEVEPHYMIYVDRINNLDTMEVHVELKEEFFSSRVNKIQEITKRLRAQVESTLGISAEIKLVEPKSIPRSEGKAVRVKDNRKNK
ncbi:MAG: phenylacetate--CoA ligase [Clostridia bacterium]|nr:phenylacetate--CoA ligase [Clostridia bacterium]